MDIRKLQRAIVDGLEDVKAQQIAVFNTEHLSPLFERVIIASGTSNRQTKALAASVRDTVKSRGMQVLRTEGEDNGEWIIVDCGAAVAHIMQPAIRDYYHLEEIWGGKAVRMKQAGDAAAGRLPKASEPDDDEDAAAASKTPRKAAARKAPAAEGASDTPARKAAPRRAAAKSGARTAGTSGAASKTPASKSAASKSAASKGAASKGAAATRAGSTSTAAKRAGTTTAGSKTAATKTAARQAPAKAARPART
jgi:ribosome-associated protein